MAQILSSFTSVLPELPPSDGNFYPPSYKMHVPLVGRDVVLDGLNLIFSQRNTPRFSNFLTVLLEVARVARNGCSYFDASTWHYLKDAGRFADIQAYLYLLRTYPRYFVEVEAGTQADSTILAVAQRRSALVVSNDKFRDYRDEYPWVETEGCVLPVNRRGDHLHFNDHRLFIHDNLHAQMRELESLL